MINNADVLIIDECSMISAGSLYGLQSNAVRIEPITS